MFFCSFLLVFQKSSFGQKCQNFPSFIVKNGPEKWTPKPAKNAFFVVLKSSSFPTEKGKMCCFSQKKQATDWSKGYYLYACMYVCMCIYICAVGLINWPSKVNNLAICFYLFFLLCFFVFFQKSSSFCRENAIFEKKV